MKINNETKIGVLAVVGVVALILGFNFLKGNHLFKKEKYIYAVFEDVQGLTKSNPVVINGLQVGKVVGLEGGKNLKRILVTVTFTHDVNIPNNSLAVVNPTLLGGVSLEIKLGASNIYLKPGDTLITSTSGTAFDEALKRIDPVLYEVRNATKSLDSVLRIVGSIFDASAKADIRATVGNLRSTTASFTVSAVSLQTLLEPVNGSLAKTLKNVHAFTDNLLTNNDKLNKIMANADKASTNLANLDFQPTITKLNSAIDDLKAGIAKINNNNGSLGLLLNDTKLYNNLSATSNKINILLDDIRVHPKRYISISVFGKKDKGNYITAPLVDDTIKVVENKK